MRSAIGFTLAFVLAATGAMSATRADTLDQIRRTGVLLVGVTEDSPPFSFRGRGSGTLIGYDVDFAQAIARRLGVDVRLRPVTAENRVGEIVGGGVDLLIGGLTRSKARKALLDFSHPHVVSGQKLITRRGEVSSLDDLRGKRIGAVVGTFAEACARDRCTVSMIVPFDDYLEGVKALEAGKIEAFTADESILVDLVAGLSPARFEIPDVLILREEYRIGVRKGDVELLEFLNDSIRALQQSGEADRIRVKWFTPKQQPPPAYGSVVRKAVTRPRFLGLVLSGLLFPESEVQIFSLSGERVGRGRITSVYGDEFYLDVEDSIYDFVRPGFLVAMNMNADMAMDVLMRRQRVLEGVKSSAEQDAEAVEAQIAQEAEAKQRRAIEMDTYRERLEESTQAERSRYFRNYGRRYRRRF